MVDTFPIIPRQSGAAGWVIAPAAVLVVLIAVAVVVGIARTLAASRTARFEVSAAGLRLRGDSYGRLIPTARLRPGEARAVDLRAERGLQPVSRTFGTALPGYQAGWFRLRDGERALVYVTDPARVAYVPTTEGYAVRLSVADPAALVASVQRAAGGARPTP